MRLHNRIIKAAFWTDTDLVRYLDRDGRMFYIGLTQLADDSGCLEDDLLAFKMHLYPADNDVDLDFIQHYRDKLVEMGKLIPYESDGKACLYLKNFHKHQSLRSPAPPSVPLPDWIQWEPGKKKHAPGKYTVEEPYGNRTVAVPKPYGNQIEPEPEREPEPEGNQKTNTDLDSLSKSEHGGGPEKPESGNSAAVADGEVYRVFEQEFGRPLSPIEAEQIDQWRSKHPGDVILEALKRAVLRGKMGFAYINRILLEWDKAGIRSLADVAQRDPPRPRGGNGNTSQGVKQSATDRERDPLGDWETVARQQTALRNV